jgi:transposase
MSLRTSLDATIPEETIRVARAACPKGHGCMQRRDARGPLYPNAQFGSLFSPTGHPAEAPARLALMLVRQCAAGLSERQAADAVRGRIDWQYVLALDLTDPGFEASVLREFRTRLRHGAAAHLLLETLLTLRQARHRRTARGTQRPDSTPMLAAIRTLHRRAWVGETLRDALQRLAVVAPAWLRAHRQPAWGERYGTRGEHERFPTADPERQQLAATIGADGCTRLLAASAPAASAEVRSAPAVEVLRPIWGPQDYGPEPGPRWRRDGDVPPPAPLLHAPDDVAARYSRKRGLAWVGYTEHLTEPWDDDTPHVLTPVETTPATTPDDNLGETIHAALDATALVPQDHLVDCGSTDAALLVESDRTSGVHMLGPVAADPSGQAREGTGCANRALTIDGATRTATCPRGTQRTQWPPDRDWTGQEGSHIRLAPQACQACEGRPACPRAKTPPRPLLVRPQLYHAALQTMRQRQLTAALQAH